MTWPLPPLPAGADAAGWRINTGEAPCDVARVLVRRRDNAERRGRVADYDWRIAGEDSDVWAYLPLD